MRKTLTESFLRGNPQPGRWDDIDGAGHGTGLYAIVARDGRITFGVRYNPPGRRNVDKRLPDGEWLPDRAGMSVTDARAMARHVRAAARAGKDMLADPATPSLDGAVMLADYWDNVVLPAIKRDREPATVEHHEGHYRRDIKARYGRISLQSITRRDVLLFREELTERRSKSMANQCIATLGAIFARAMADPRLDPPLEYNPCHGVPRHYIPARTRACEAWEIRKIWSKLDDYEAEGRFALNALLVARALWLTGRRVGEIVGLRWPEHMEHDDQGEWFFVPGSEDYDALFIHVTDQLRDLISRVDRRDNYVFPHWSHVGEPISDAYILAITHAVCHDLGIADMVTHDIRASVSTRCENEGEALFQAGDVDVLLGHRLQGVTAKHYLRTLRAKSRRVQRTAAKFMLELATSPEPNRDNVVRLRKSAAQSPASAPGRGDAAALFMPTGTAPRSDSDRGS